MTQQVTLEDGSVHLFPDDATPEEMSAALPSAQQLNASPEHATGSPVQNALAEQGQPLETSNQVAHGEYSAPEEDFRQIGLAGRDIEGAVPTAIAGGIDLVNNLVMGGANAANKYLGTNIPTTGVMMPSPDMETNAVQKALSATGLFPEPQNAVEKGTGTLASVLLGGGEQGVNTLKQAGSNLLDFFRGNGISTPTTSEAMKTIANGFYQKADDLGGTFSPDFSDNFLAKMNGKPPTTPVEMVAAQTDPLKQFASQYSSIAGKPMSLSDAQLLDEKMGDFIDGEYGVNGLSKQGKNMLDAQSSFRQSMKDAAGNGQVQGTPDGIQALEDGRAAWSQAAKMRDLEKIQTRATFSDNPATTIRSGVRTLLSNPARVRGYSDDELDALQGAAKTGLGVDTLRVFGSRLMPMIASAAGEATGGPAGAVVAGALTHGASTLARNAATNIQSGRLQNVFQVLGQDYPSTPLPSPYPNLTGLGRYLPAGAAGSVVSQQGANQ